MKSVEYTAKIFTAVQRMSRRTVLDVGKLVERLLDYLGKGEGGGGNYEMN